MFKSLNGKIRAVALKKVKEGMQVLSPMYDGNYVMDYSIKKVLCVVNGLAQINTNTKSFFKPKDLKTLVIEYEQESSGQTCVLGLTDSDKYELKQLPLSPSQWKKVIDDELIDRTVVFEIKDNPTSYEDDETLRPMIFHNFYAKIVTKKKPSNSKKKHLQWIYDRMTNVHNEDEQYDYMIKFKEIIDSL